MPFEDRDVDFLPATKALHDAGFNVLLFDLRHHGESDAGASRSPTARSRRATYIGAVNYLRSRPDVDGERIGAIGTSMGGNIVLYGDARVPADQGHPAVQPTRLTVFNTNFARTELGPLGPR